ncbi:hypothetical protein CDAR_372851 [Caerostris darwini]|uniref:Uncharacterized protein n=1 Tax=Caerostris darwini TaxID=1538125 RepID=A0AAV4RUP9_9ARAC|nr:hypothetical protein CDAR_372741 [Caerostris darwini]GIY24432.1 hypothetical protein CDAR_372851 [Caerostris darwini]
MHCTSLLIEVGTYLNTKDFEGARPQHAASFRNCSVYLDLLLRAVYSKEKRELFELRVQSPAQPVLLKNLGHRIICTSLGHSRLEYLYYFNIPTCLQMYLII